MMDSKYRLGSSGGFFNEMEDDMDDEYFLSGGRSGQSQPRTNNQSVEAQRLQMECEQIQRRSVASTHRSLALINESEQVGVAAAEQLLHQREQLQNSERKVDEINKNLNRSQRHINSLKSFVGGLTNMFSKPSSSTTTTNTTHYEASGPTNTQLSNALEVSKSQTSATTSSLNHPGFSYRHEEYGDQRTTQSFTKQVERQLDSNLDELSDGITRLHGLAKGLGDEIESQNDILDRLNSKVDQADFRVSTQNKQMQKILGKQ